jgi:hypothetical protein
MSGMTNKINYSVIPNVLRNIYCVDTDPETFFVASEWKELFGINQ